MQCKECGREMYLVSTKGWSCKCGIQTDIQGNLVFRGESKVKISSIRNNTTIATIATIKIIKPTVA
jgi:hypothetical protein